jgi:hypothetical protein
LISGPPVGIVQFRVDFWSAPFFLLHVVHPFLPELICSKVALSLVALPMAP